MGAWGLGAFDNDIAADWALEIDALDDAGRVAAVHAALRDVLDGDEDGEVGEVEGDIALAVAAWLLLHDGAAPIDGAPSAVPPSLDSRLRIALFDAIDALLSPTSGWLERQWELGVDGLEEAAAIAAALRLPDPRTVRSPRYGPNHPATEPHHAEAVPVDDETVTWRRDDPRFRVRRFAADATAVGGWRVAAVDDIVDGEVTDALLHAEETMSDGDWLAISLITTDASGVVGETWLVGTDPRDPVTSDADRMRVRRVALRAGVVDPDATAHDGAT